MAKRCLVLSLVFVGALAVVVVGALLVLQSGLSNPEPSSNDQIEATMGAATTRNQSSNPEETTTIRTANRETSIIVV